MKHSYLVIIPVYNSETTILPLLKRLSVAKVNNFLFVNDGSTDNTGRLLTEQSLSHLDHGENRGKGGAVMTGLNYAVDNGYDYVITMDADLQHPPESISHLVDEIHQKTVVLGWRNDYSGMPIFRILSNRITSLLLSLRTGVSIKDSQCGFRAFPTKIVSELTFTQRGFQFESEFLIKSIMAGYGIRHVAIPTIYSGEKSAMRIIHDTVKFIAMYFRSFLW